MESPYFRRPTDNQTIRASPKSPFFSLSPTSVQGSAISLGPLLASWGTDQPRSICCRTAGSNKICPLCQDLISEAVRHYEDCAEFRATCDTRTTKPFAVTQFCLDVEELEGISCVEIMSVKMERQVRHLCPKMCYLRAYSPSRDWWALRQALAQQSDVSVTRLLQHWTCKLERGDSGKKCKQIVGTTGVRKRVPLLEEKLQQSEINPENEERKSFGTIFVNRLTGKRFSSAFQVVRELTGRGTADEEYESKAEASSRPSVSGIGWKLRLPENKRATNEQIQKLDGFRCATLDGDGHNKSLYSPLGLLEELFGENPFQLLLSTILLNRTRRTQVDRVLHDFLERWPTPNSIVRMAQGEGVGSLAEMTNLIAPLGIKNRRARGIVRFSKEYLELLDACRQNRRERGLSNGMDSNRRSAKRKRDGAPDSRQWLTEDSKGSAVDALEFCFTRDDIRSLYHCGEYAADAYQIFILRDWEELNPSDHALLAFVEWKRSTRDEERRAPRAERESKPAPNQAD